MERRQREKDRERERLCPLPLGSRMFPPRDRRALAYEKAREAVQKVKERGSRPMRDNNKKKKSTGHTGLCGVHVHHYLRPPHAPPSVPDHFHTPDATATMTVDRKLLAKSSRVMWKSRWQFLSCVTTLFLPALFS